MSVLTRQMADDLLGRPTGPMIPMDEAAAGGRPEVLVDDPEGTYNVVREFPPGGALVSRPNAYNTGRVRTLTPENFIRDFPAEGGVNYSAQQERMKSYRTRAETYSFIPYDEAKPIIGNPMWPAKRLFPYNPTIKQVDEVDHDIVPGSSRTSKRDSLVVPVDGDDSKRGFSIERETKGDMAMLYGMGEEFFEYGGPTPNTESSVNEHDILTLVDWDDQKHDWQLNGLGANAASRIAHKIARLAAARARDGHFKSLDEAVQWMRTAAEEIRTKRIAKIDAAVKVAVEEAIRLASPQIEKILARKEKRQGRIERRDEARMRRLNDYLSDGDLGGFNWSGRGFRWHGQRPDQQERVMDATAKVQESSRDMRRRKPSMPGKGRGRKSWGRFGLRGMEYPEYADNQDTSGWNTESNDTFAYIPNLGSTAEDAWKASLVTSLNQDPQAAQQVTSAATNTVTQAIKTGEVSTTNQIVGALTAASKAAADAYAAKVLSKAGLTPAQPKPTVGQKMMATIVAPDQPLWKRPLFWAGAALLVGVGGFALLSGGKGRGRSRSRARRSRRNGILPFTAYSNRSRRWKSRWA